MGMFVTIMFSILTSLVPQTSTGVASWNLGVKFRVSAPGKITEIKYFRKIGDNGPHIGQVWNAAGQKIAEVTFAIENGTEGWQTQALVTPVAVVVNSNTIVSVTNPVGAHYALLPGGFTTALVDGPVTYLASGGSYGTVGLFPASSTPTNYFRDFTFVPDVLPTIVVTADTAPGSFTVKTDKFTAGKYDFGVYMRDANGQVINSTPIKIDMPNQVTQ